MKFLNLILMNVNFLKLEESYDEEKVKSNYYFLLHISNLLSPLNYIKYIEYIILNSVYRSSSTLTSSSSSPSSSLLLFLLVFIKLSSDAIATEGEVKSLILFNFLCNILILAAEGRAGYLIVIVQQENRTNIFQTTIVS